MMVGGMKRVTVSAIPALPKPMVLKGALVLGSAAGLITSFILVRSVLSTIVSVLNGLGAGLLG